MTIVMMSIYEHINFENNLFRHLIIYETYFSYLKEIVQIILDILSLITIQWDHELQYHPDGLPASNLKPLLQYLMEKNS